MIADDPVVKKGVSTSKNPHEAARELFQAIYQPEATFGLFYCSADCDLDELGKALNELFGDIPLVGCTTAGEITPEGFLDGSITGFTIRSEKIRALSTLISLENFSMETVERLHEELYKKMLGSEACELPPVIWAPVRGGMVFSCFMPMGSQ